MQHVQKGDLISANKFNQIIDNININNNAHSNITNNIRTLDNNNGLNLEQFDILQVLREDYSSEPYKIDILFDGGSFQYNGELKTVYPTSLIDLEHDYYVYLILDTAMLESKSKKEFAPSNDVIILGEVVYMVEDSAEGANDGNKMLTYKSFSHGAGAAIKLPFQVGKIKGVETDQYYLTVTAGYIYLDNDRYMYIPAKTYVPESPYNVLWRDGYFVKLNIRYNLDGTISYKYTMEESNGTKLTVSEYL